MHALTCTNFSSLCMQSLTMLRSTILLILLLHGYICSANAIPESWKYYIEELIKRYLAISHLEYIGVTCQLKKGLLIIAIVLKKSGGIKCLYSYWVLFGPLGPTISVNMGLLYYFQWSMLQVKFHDIVLSIAESDYTLMLPN